MAPGILLLVHTKKIFVDKALSHFDLWEWCGRLKIPLKGIFARDEKMGKNHSPCVINLDSSEGTGTLGTGFAAGLIITSSSTETRSDYHLLWYGKRTSGNGFRR